MRDVAMFAIMTVILLQMPHSIMYGWPVYWVLIFGCLALWFEAVFRHQRKLGINFHEATKKVQKDVIESWRGSRLSILIVALVFVYVAPYLWAAIGSKANP